MSDDYNLDDDWDIYPYSPILVNICISKLRQAALEYSSSDLDIIVSELYVEFGDIVCDEARSRCLI